jgi:hypothetical protein
MRRPLTVAVAVTASVAVAVPAAYAAWQAAGTGGGSATARSLVAATFGAGDGASASGTTVTIKWASGANPAGTTHQVVRNSTPVQTLACTSSPCSDSGAPSGTYNYTITPKLNNWTGASVTTGNVTVAAVQTATPTTPTLLQVDDSGTSNSDNITNVAQPRFTGTATANSMVRLYRAGVDIGSVQLTGGATDWTITPTAAVAEGSAAITATAQVSGQTMSAASSPRSVTFDRTAPTLTASGTSSNATNQTASGSYGRVAGDLAAVSLTLTATEGNGACTVPATATLNNSAGTWTATVSVSSRGTTCTVAATQADSAGNTGSATTSVTRT